MDTKPFQTGAQVVIDASGGAFSRSTGKTKEDKARLPKEHRESDREFKRMMRDPTIKLAIDIVTALLMRQPWTVDGPDERICNFVWSQIEPYRKMIIRSAVRGMFHTGWRAFELVYDIQENISEELGTRQVLVGIKALNERFTDPLAYKDTGEFAGVDNTSVSGEVVRIDEDHCIFVSADEDGLGALPEPLLRSVQETFRKWEKCDEGAQRYDDKVAGGFLAIGYPVGTNKVRVGNTTVDKDNVEIAELFAKSIKSAGYGLYPRKPDPETGEFTKNDWTFEHVGSAGGLQPNFVTRAKYLDALKLRVCGIPERAATEGTFGTKAEAEEHADIAIMVNTERHDFILHGVNRGFTKPFCMANFGDAGAARLILGELDPDSRTLFSSIFTTLMGDPVFADRTAARVDVEMLMDKLNIPVLAEESFSEGPGSEAEDTVPVDTTPPENKPGQETE